MKFSRYLTALLSLMFLLAASSLAQTPKKPSTAKYDAKLAKKLGGDKHGMKMYVIAFLKTGPKVLPDGEEKSALFAGHMANIGKLADEGKLAVAGPFEKNEAGFRGIFILNVDNLDDARKLVETDPVVKSGLMIVELYKWFGSASLLATPEIHKSIEAPTK